jgi:hypothetical protein
MPNAELCPLCKVGAMKAAGPPFPDSGGTAGKLKEMKVVYACNECGYSEERNAEPTNIDRGEGEE